jgi:hypothetical protein
MANYGYTHTACERIRAARVAQLIEQFEKHGWPLGLVQFLNANPGVGIHEALLDQYQPIPSYVEVA